MLLAEYQSWSNIFGVKLNRIGVTRTSKVWYHFTFLLVKASKYLRLDWECKLGFLFPSHHKQPDREIQITEYTCDVPTPVLLTCALVFSCLVAHVMFCKPMCDYWLEGTKPDVDNRPGATLDLLWYLLKSQ